MISGTRPHLRALTVATTAAAALLVAAHPAAAAPADGIANVAHRGSSTTAPENTLSAMTQAVASRADFVGIDVHLTRDGVPVVIHDTSLARTTNAEQVYPRRSPWNVGDFTLDEIERLDAGSWKSDTYTGEKVPTLQQVLHELHGSPTGILLEIKSPNLYGGVDGIGAKVVDLMAQEWPESLVNDGTRRILVQCFDISFLSAFHDKYPTIKLGALSPLSSADMQQYKNVLEDTQANQNVVDQAYVDEAHTNGYFVGAWTVDSITRMDEIADLGVDSITTNRPGVLRDELAARGMTYTPTQWPDRQSKAPFWQLTSPGGYLNTRIPVEVTMTQSDGSAARWQWGDLEAYRDGVWRTVQTRATDSQGVFDTTVLAKPGLRLRVVGQDDRQYPVARSTAQAIDLRKVPTTVRLRGVDSIRKGTATRLSVRWRTADARLVTGSATLWRRPAGGSWVPVRDVSVRDGVGSVRVHPKVSTRFEIRAHAGWWWTADTARKRVLVTGR